MTDKIALVTGAGSGIGRAAALALLDAGWRVVLAGRRREELEITAAHAPGRTLVAPTDITDEAQVDALFAATAQAFGRLDLLFNNAGASAGGRLEDLSLEAWRRVVDVNLTGAFLCTRAAFRMMKAQDPRGGRIINNGSISATAPRPYSAPYTATKHAITGLTKSLALDYRNDNICCCQIDLGNVAVERTAEVAKGARVQADGAKRPEAQIDVSVVADTIVYLANLPPEANVPFMTVMANAMPFMGRG